MVNQTVTGFTNITGLSNQSNIAGSLPLQKSREDIAVILDSDSMTNLVNFGSIVQVQYLQEYNASLGIKQQNWAILTSEVYNRSNTGSSSLLCRLILMSDTLDAPVIINLQPLASLFILGPAPTPPGFRTHVQVFQAFLNNFTQSNREALTYMNSSVILYANNIPIGEGNSNQGGPRPQNSSNRISTDIVVAGAGY